MELGEAELKRRKRGREDTTGFASKRSLERKRLRFFNKRYEEIQKKKVLQMEFRMLLLRLEK